MQETGTLPPLARVDIPGSSLSQRSGIARCRFAGRGFTLVELMIAICIIGIMASILIPSFKRAKAESQLAACCSNLRALYTATNMHANDNGGLLPRPTSSWAGFGAIFTNTDQNFLLLKPYVPTSKSKCPAWDQNVASNCYIIVITWPAAGARYSKDFVGVQHNWSDLGPSGTAAHAFLLGNASGYPLYGGTENDQTNSGLSLAP